MTTIVGGVCPRCGQFHDLFLAVDGSIVCRNADGAAERIRQLEADRDAARAEVERLRSPEWEAEARADQSREVAALRERFDRVRRERDAARAEVDALQVFAQDANEAFASGRREVLADLRTKVEGLPVLITDMHNGTGPHYYEHTVLFVEVLALIDGAQ